MLDYVWVLTLISHLVFYYMSIIKEFMDVFLKELRSAHLNRDNDLDISLESRTKKIPNSSYQIALMELKELKD